MAKTINNDIDIFPSLHIAERAFEKSKVPCQLLRSNYVKSIDYFIDRSKTAIKEWPKLYTLIKEK